MNSLGMSPVSFSEIASMNTLRIFFRGNLRLLIRKILQDFFHKFFRKIFSNSFIGPCRKSHKDFFGKCFEEFFRNSTADCLRISSENSSGILSRDISEIPLNIFSGNTLIDSFENSSKPLWGRIILRNPLAISTRNSYGFPPLFFLQFILELFQR